MVAYSPLVIRQFPADLRLATAFLTRLPVAPEAVSAVDVTRCLRCFPLVAAGIGLAIGALVWLLIGLGLPPLAAAAMGLMAQLLLTGALHEDGLADIADGFGGGMDRPRKLEIMRDSRVGTYGAAALTLSLLARASLIAALPGPWLPLGLMLVEALSRLPIPVLMCALPKARRDGLGASMEPVPGLVLFQAALWAFLPLLLLPQRWQGSVLILACLGSAAAMALLAKRQIGGFTGDVLGGAQQAALMVCLAVLVGMQPWQ